MIRAFYTIGWILTALGGLSLIILGIAAVFGIFWLIFYPIYALSAVFWGIIIGIMGLICLGGARFVNNLGTAILLLLIGIGASLLGVWFISWLIIIGAILGILSRL
jgi:hypothetical protein